MWNDLYRALRLLTRDRSFTLAAVGALTVGLAANILVFTLLNGVVFSDLPFTDPGRLAAIKSVDARNDEWNLSYPDFRDLQALAPRTLSSVAAADQSPMTILDDSANATRRLGAYVTADAFRLLGQRPQRGRDFTARDDQPGAEPVVMLGHELWQQGFGGDAAIVGRSVRLAGVATTVIGVMPPGFGFPDRSELWQPLVAMPEAVRQRRDVRGITAVGRLAPEATIVQARADVETVMAGLARQFPDTNTGIRAGLIPYREEVVGNRAARILSTLMGAVAVLLVLACANVANLLLARAGVRAREVSIRTSMGASRWRIVRQLLMESLVLAATAGLAGLGLGAAGVRIFAAAFERVEPPYWLTFPLDWRVFTFVAAACLGTTCLFGLLPALQASKVNVGDVLNQAGRASTSGIRTRRWSDGLIVVQVALALVLLSAGGLMLRGTLAAAHRDAGIETSGLVSMRIELPRQRYPSAEQQTAFFRQLDDRLAALPGMRAALATPAPRMGGPERRLAIEGQPALDEKLRPRVTTVAVGRRYFDTLNITPRHGRGFEPLDGTPGRAAVIVNERFVERYLPSGNAVGRRIELGPDGPFIGATGWLPIVGVVPNVRQNEEEESPFDTVAYLPYAAFALPNAMLLARSELGVAAVAGAMRDTVRHLDADLPLFEIATLDDAVAAEVWPLRIFGTLFGTFAVSALVLAALGLYAVTAYATARRTREIGLRVALGARPRHIWWTVSGRGAVQIGVGLAIGLAGALTAGGVLASVMPGVDGSDPWTFTVVPGVLIAVAFVACLIPARRAIRINPVEALRAE